VPAKSEVSLPIKNRHGRVLGSVVLSLLPGANVAGGRELLVEESDALRSDAEVPPVQLLEGCEYRFELQFLGSETGLARTDRPEVFQPDTHHGCTGRVRPGLHTGALPVTVFRDETEVGSFAVEVRARKLEYRSEYRWMLRDIAEYMTEVVMDRFGVAEQRFTFDDTRDAVTLYERFAFLKGLIASDEFQGALNRIVSRPHVVWHEDLEVTPSGRGIKADSHALKQLSRPGARLEWPNGRLKTLPVALERRRTDASTDNTPNRFVKFALSRWRSVVAYISSVLRDGPPTPSTLRGIAEVEHVLNDLDSVLASELFRATGELSKFPADDQVLQKKPAYRDVYRAYIQFEVASKLSWQGGDDVYGAGQRDVAALYEYWAFLTLAEQLSTLLDTSFDFGRLIELRQHGLNVALKTGSECVLHGLTVRRGRQLAVELWFNRTYSAVSRTEGAWSRSMRPDYSIYIRPALSEAAKFEPVVLHFDAKYRVNFLDEVFGIAGEPQNRQNEAVTSVDAATATRDDLLKMHAYRDAIRRSIGAYVLYPGTEHEVIREYHELLPGLGAFALRPTANGVAEGAHELSRFLEDVLNHVASQISQDERGRYWLHETFSGRSYAESVIPPARFLSMPPADTLVLLGYVRDNHHWEWIDRTGLYNLRAYGSRGAVGLGSKQLACEIVVLSSPSLDRVGLYRVTKVPVVRSLEQMLEMEYPNPRGSYFCLSVDPIEDSIWQALFTSQLIETIRSERTSLRGGPVVVSWLDLVTRVS
jgi:predicted component of viral defense system (DUF524 family)